jgi:4-amino-4-deoxychorismate lyase
MKVFINGTIVQDKEAVISVFDHGFLYGVALFETMRAYQERIFLFDEHYARLKSSADAYGIALTYSQEELLKHILATIQANELGDAYVRVTVSSGVEGLGLIGQTYFAPSWVIMVKPIVPMSSNKSLTILQLRRSTPDTEPRAKSTSFVNNVLAKKELEKRNQADREGIFLNREEQLVEGIVSNLFFVRQGKLYTPHTATGLLPGVTRECVLRLAQELGIPTEEGFYQVSDLLGSEEVLLTNSIQEIVPVDAIDEHKLPVTKGKITTQLTNSYQSLIQQMLQS